jgi:pimeloyl-ACP methyl ester carboxylesterase/DNA-binding winged helix-turn-helix (wHTH) protein
VRVVRDHCSVLLRFGDCELDLDRVELRRHGVVVPVEPQVFDVLAYLARNGDRAVPKDELLDHVWGSRFVSESAITSRIKSARRAVGDTGSQQTVIRTIHGRGYRFVADIAEVGHRAAVTGSSPTAPHQDVRFCRASDGVRLAVASAGTGSPLVKAANWLTHVRYDWQSAVWRHWLRDLSARHRLVHYDERGCGLSDWDVADVSFEAWVHDLETVADAAGLARFPLLGMSQGGAVAATFAARHPDRVSHLVLYGSFPLGRRRRARNEDELREADVMLQLLRSGWGREDSPFGRMFAAQFMPDGSLEQWAAFVELQRRTTSAENALRLMSVSAEIDVTDIAPLVRAPTLVLHATGDQVVPREQGELFASLVPGARFVALEGANHVLLAHEPAWSRFLTEVEAFLGGTRVDG